MQPPAHAQAVDGHAGGQQQAQLAPQRSAVQLARDQRVDHVADLARQPDDQHRDADQHHARRGIGAPMAATKPPIRRDSDMGRARARARGLRAGWHRGADAAVGATTTLAERLPDRDGDSRVASRGFGGLARLEGLPEPPLKRACWAQGVGSRQQPPSHHLAVNGQVNRPQARPDAIVVSVATDASRGTAEVGSGRAAVFSDESGAGEPPLATACRRVKVPSRRTRTVDLQRRASAGAETGLLTSAAARDCCAQ